MKPMLARILAGSATLLLSSVAIAQDAPPPDQAPQDAPPEAAPPPPDQMQQAPQDQQAQQEAPPPVNIAPPAATAPGAFPPGQWVSTSQYGWVWMPYGQNYTYAPTEAGGDPYQYLYSQTYGWRWLPAPWVFGIRTTALLRHIWLRPLRLVWTRLVRPPLVRISEWLPDRIPRRLLQPSHAVLPTACRGPRVGPRAVVRPAQPVRRVERREIRREVRA